MPRSSGSRTPTSRPAPISARRGLTTLRRVILPLAVPGIAAGSIFTFSLTLGDYIAPTLVGGPSSQLIGNVVFANVGVANNVPFAAAFATVPLAIMAVYLMLMKRLGSVREPLMETRGTRIGLGVWALLVVAFLWIPLLIMAVYAFNSSNVQSWPIPGFSTKWFSAAWHDEEVRTAIGLSLRAASRSDRDRARARLARRLRAQPLRVLRPETRSRSCSCCRSHCPGSSPAWL